MRHCMRGAGVLGALLGMLVAAGPATAADTSPDAWLPNQANASWTYGWSDSVYAKTVSYEHYTVDKRSDSSVTLRWTTADAGNAPDAPLSAGTIDYGYSASGIVNNTWSSTPPPPQFPVLCAQVGQCGNSTAGAHYTFIWGTRSPLLQEPLSRGAVWLSSGGQSGDVSAVNRYRGVQRVVVPAFPKGVFAAVVDSDITQAGAIGDPYGSGSRTTWWVYGVGPVKSVFRHAGGEVTTVNLFATNLTPRTPPSDRAYLPFRKGDVMRFRYTNSKHFRTPSVQQFTVTDAQNNSTRVDSKSLSGPIAAVGIYLLTTRTTGVFNTSFNTSSATRVRFPKLGPKSLPPSERRHFYTPFDLMEYGFNPVIPAFPKTGQTWTHDRKGRDFEKYGVLGTTKVVGFQRIRTRAGRFKALLVQSRLTQPGFPYGSGVRKSWFAPGVGLVKLEFRHRDGSVSRVERLP